MFRYPGITQCPAEWEYKDHPNYDPSQIAAVTRRWLANLRADHPELRRSVCTDTQPFHRGFFQALAPDAAPYFAGNYRGQPYFCLEHLSVTIPSDPRVGEDPHFVVREMSKLGLAIEQAATRISFMFANPEAYMTNRVVLQMVHFVATAFVKFLTIHPFANGNGHAARFLLNALFGSFDFWIVSSFPVHKRPSPDYSQMIYEFRGGNTTPLVQFLLSCLA